MLTVHNVHRSFGTSRVLRGIDLTLEQGEILCLLGPSGCGKTTLLRIIAGLELTDSGDIRLGGQSILHTPVHERGFGLMFQDFALFPHLDVANNVAFGLKMKHIPKTERETRVREALERVNLSGFGQRAVATLSGGERQRVALARSVAAQPRLLMLDEPLGSLDAALREELLSDLRKIIKREDLSTIYVTHDQHEAFVIADRIAVMKEGRLEQIDAPQNLYFRPKTEFVARFLGLYNIIPVMRCADGIASTALGEFPVQRCTGTILLHPHGIDVAGTQANDTIAVTIEETVFQGSSYRVRVRHQSGITLTFSPSAQGNHGFDYSAGSSLSLHVAANSIIPLAES